MNNGGTLGTAGFFATDVVLNWDYNTQIKSRSRVKTSGLGGHRTHEGMLMPAEFTLKMKAQTGIPLSWVLASDNEDATPNNHIMSIPALQNPTISSTGITAIPALGIRIERETGTNANQRIDLLGCVVTKLVLNCPDGEMATWEVSGKTEMILAGVTTISSHASDYTDSVFNSADFSMSTFTYNSQSVAFQVHDYTLTIELKWKEISPGVKATSYKVYTNWLLQDWDCSLELRGQPYEDGTKSSVYTIARTAIASYATALAATMKAVRTANSDEIEFGFDKWELTLEKQEGNREEADYEICTIKLVPAASSTLTCHVHDARDGDYYGGQS